MTPAHVGSLLACLPLALAAGGPLAQEGRALAPEQAARLVADYLGGKEKKAAEARALLLETRAEDRRVLFDALEAGQPDRIERARNRRAIETIATPEAELPETDYVVRWPSSRHKPPFPLLIRLHGSGGSAQSFDGTHTAKAFDGFVIVTPEIPSRDRQAWNDDGGQEVVDRLYRKAIAELAVDPDRVYLSGFSAGSGGAMKFAEFWPHRFAGLHCVGRLWHADDDEPEWSMAAAYLVPGVFIVGLRDREERIDGFLAAEEYAERWSLDWTFHFDPDRGHVPFSDMDEEALTWLREKVRVRYPKKICAVYHFYRNEEEEAVGRRRVYWLEATEHTPFAPASGVVDGQTITVDAPRVKKGFVLVNDRLLDLDLPVTLVVNEATVFEGLVERSVEHLLGSWEADRDPGLLYWNRIEFGG
jgi:predicted esterase